jgi:hypothetical protein
LPQGGLMLTVPLLTKGHLGRTIREIEINTSENWQKKHWKSIEQNYRKAPFFNRYAPWFESIYSREWHRLIDLTNAMLSFFLAEMGIKTNVIAQSSLKLKSHKQELVLDLCMATKAHTYISGKLGRDYLNLDQFIRSGIHVHFQDYRHPTYQQLGMGEFVPNLGVVDLLMNVGPDRALEIILSGNISKEEFPRRTS